LPAAGQPTQITLAILEGHLMALGRALAGVLAPADPATERITDETAWNGWISRMAGMRTPTVIEAVSKIKLVYDRLVEQFGSDAPALVAMNFWMPTPVPTVEKCRPWHPPDGRPVPEIEPQDVRTLAWAAAQLFHCLGEEAQAKAAESILPWAELLLRTLDAKNPSVDLGEKAPPGRLVFDSETHTVTLDGRRYGIDDPKAFGVYKVIVDRDTPCITKARIREKVLGVKGDKTIPRLIQNLPRQLRSTVRATTNGYSIRLPDLLAEKDRESP
jgi:hypothetical protein